MTWQFKANFSNVTPAGTKRTIPQDGFYKVRIRETEETTTKAGNARALLRLVVAEGEHTGSGDTYGVNFPIDSDDWVLSYWMVLLISCGVSREKLEKGEVTIKADSLKGKAGYIHYACAAEGGYATIKWLEKHEYDFQMKLQGKAQVEEPAPAEEPAPKVAKAPADNGDPLSFLEI